MSISPVGNSDAYERYREQQLNLLASSAQTTTQNAPTTTSSPVAPANSTDQTSTNPFALKFKADLTALNSQSNASGSHGAHGHHHAHNGGAVSNTETNLIDPNATTDSTGSTSSTDPFSLALDQLADVVKSTTGTQNA